MDAIWPWLLLAGLGAFHGLNPAMGWLFAVALGVHRQSAAAVVGAVPAIAAGHALSVALAAGAVVAFGLLVEPGAVRAAAGLGLIGWALWHVLFGHRRRVRVGMRVGLGGLVAWSFLMATAHGAGLMLAPALLSLCLGGAGATMGPAGSTATTIAAVLVHSLAMLAATGSVAFVVYRWVGVGILRRAWINLDRVWAAVLLLTGVGLLLF